MPTLKNPRSATSSLLTVQQAAEYMNVSKRTIIRLTNLGELRKIRLGRVVRIDRRDLDKFIESGGSAHSED